MRRLRLCPWRRNWTVMKQEARERHQRRIIMVTEKATVVKGVWSELDRRLRSDIYQPATTLKIAISRRRPRFLQTVPSLYGTHLLFSRQFYSPVRIYTGSDKTPHLWTARLHHSAISNPHLLTRLYEESHSKTFQGSPLRSFWFPGYVQ